MDRITRFSLKNAAAVILVAVLVTAGGLWSASQLNRETMPDIDIPVVAVITVYPGAAPNDVYDDVTEPIEKAMRGVAGIDKVSAQSGDSVSMVIGQFSYSQDMDAAETDINKVLQTVKLPDTAIEPKVSRISMGSAPIMKLAIIGDEANAEALRTKVRDDVIPALQGIEGVGEANLAADAPANILIEFDAEALEDEGLTTDAVIQQLKASNMAFPIGTVDLGSATEPIRAGGTIDSVEDIEDFRIAVYPNSNEMMGEAFAQIGEGMGALGEGMGALAQGMGQGFSALGEGMGALGSTTGEVAMQAGLINGIQQTQAQLYTLKYDTLPQLKAAASSMPTSAPEYGALQAQIETIEKQAIPGMQTAITSMQKQVTASQENLKKQAASAGSGSSALSSMSGGSSSSMSMPSSSGSDEMEVEIGMVTLSDVAEVTYAPDEGTVGSRANGAPAALIDIVKNQEANTVKVSEKVTAELESLKAELPAGTEVEVVYDQKNGINASVEGMMREGLLGALFAIIVILLFLRNWRATIIAAVSIPLSVMIAFVFLKQTNVTLNVMTLGGLTVAIGRVVDDSIVVIENIFRHLQRGDARTPELIRNATREVSAAITSSTLTTVAVFLPLGLVTGIIGKIFRPFAITVGLSLLASLLVAVTVVPLMAKWMLLKTNLPAGHGADSGDSKMMTTYRRALSWALDHRWTVVAGATALFVASLALVPLIGTGFVPETAEKYLQVDVTYPQGTKASVVDETVRRIETVLAKEKSIEIHQSTVGATNSSLSMSGGLGGTNTAALYIRLDSGADTDAVLERLSAQTEALETDDARIEWSATNASGTSSQLEVVVTGPDLKSIRAGADTIEAKLQERSDLENVSSNLGESRKQLVVDVNQKKASKYGMNAAMVAGSVRGYVAEQEVGTVKLDGRATDVKYVLALDPVDKATQLANLKLTSPLDGDIALKKIARVEEVASPIAVMTLDGNEYASVSGKITERDSGSVIDAVNEDLATLKLPTGVEYSIEGAAEQMNEAFSQLGVAMIVAIGAVYLVMIIAFGEAIAPLAIMFSLPLAVVGGLLGLFVAGVPLDMPAMIGALMLIGIVVTNAIVLVDRVQQKRHAGVSRREALLEAGATRMRPILMTAIATVMALAPLASGFAEGAMISQSLAVIVIGGLTTSTLLTLIVVPVIYDLLEAGKDRVMGVPTASEELAPEGA